MSKKPKLATDLPVPDPPVITPEIIEKLKNQPRNGTLSFVRNKKKKTVPKMRELASVFFVAAR